MEGQNQFTQLFFCWDDFFSVFAFVVVNDFLDYFKKLLFCNFKIHYFF